MATLWAWATPAPYEHSPVDHTWVTDYDNRVDEPPQNVAEVIAAAGNYWFCWGAFHARGESREVSQGFLGGMPRSIALANCLARSNAPSASDKPTCGTIGYMASKVSAINWRIRCCGQPRRQRIRR